MKKNVSALNGFPCHRYIVRNLTTEIDMLEFERSFIDIMHTHSVSDAEIETALLTMSTYIPKNSPINGKVFNLLGSGIEMGSLVDTITFDPSIPTYPSCTAYYKKTDRSCRACLMCEYSNKYTRGNFTSELLLIRYILAGQSNLERLIDKGLSAELFKSSFDVTEYATSPRAYPILLFQNILEALGTESIFKNYYTSSLSEFGPDIYQFLRSKIRRMRLPAAYQDKNWIDKVISVWELQIFTESVCSNADADLLLKRLQGHPDDTDTPALESPIPASPAPAINSTEESRCADSKPQTDMCQHSELQAESIMQMPSASESNILQTPAYLHETDYTSNISPEAAKPLDAPVEENAESVSDISSEATSESGADEHQDNLSEGRTVSSNYAMTPTVFEVINNSDIKGECIDVESIVTGSHPEYVTHMDMKGNLLFDPRVSKKELASCAVCLDTPNVFITTRFENAVLQDKKIAMELVHDEADEAKEAILLFWVQSLHTFFYSRMKSASKLIAPLLSHKSIRKVCYSPYSIYSFARKRELQIRSLVSLQSQHYIIDTVHTDYISAMLSYGIHPSIPGINYKSTGSINSPVFQYLPYYNTVCRIQEANLVGQSPDRCQEVAYRDEALGCSYDLSLWRTDPGCLFHLEDPELFVFADLNPAHIKIPGYLMYYVFPNTSEVSFPLKLICRLSEMGRFRKCSIWIAKMTNIGLVLFVAEPYFEYFSTLISSELLILQEKYGLRGLSVSIGYMHINPDVNPAANQNSSISGPKENRAAQPKGSHGSKENHTSGSSPTPPRSATGNATAPTGGQKTAQEKTAPQKPSDAPDPNATKKTMQPNTSRQSKTAAENGSPIRTKNSPSVSHDENGYIKPHKIIGHYSGNSLLGAAGVEYTGKDDQLPF